MDEKSNQDSASQADEVKKEVNGSTTDKTFTQTEVDKIVAERLKREQASYDERQKKAVSDAIADYERKAKLSEDERLREEFSEQESSLKKREEAITLRENRSEAIELLSDAGINTKLVEFVVDVDPDATRENVKNLTTVFNQAVSEAVEDKLKGKAPKDFGDGSKDTPASKPDLDRSRITYQDGSVAL